MSRVLVEYFNKNKTAKVDSSLLSCHYMQITWYSVYKTLETPHKTTRTDKQIQQGSNIQY